MAYIKVITMRRMGNIRMQMRIYKKIKSKGMVAIETALVLPVLLLTLFGIIGYGWVFFVYQTMSIATYEGARAGIVSGSTNQTIIATVQDRLARANLDQPCVEGGAQPCLIIQCDAANHVLTVQLSLSAEAYSLIPNNTLGLPIPDLQSTTAMYKESC